MFLVFCCHSFEIKSGPQQRVLNPRLKKLPGAFQVKHPWLSAATSLAKLTAASAVELQ